MHTDENNPMNTNPGEFGLPEGYFQHSANAIFNKIEWQEEHRQFPVLLSRKAKTGFVIPDNYFEANERKLELTDVPALAAIGRKNSFAVPDVYFENAEMQLLTAHLDENKEQEFLLLNAIPKQNAFTIPPDYFTEQEVALSKELSRTKEAKRIVLFSAKAWYAAAAALLIVLSLWTYNSYFKTAAEPEDCGTIACVDKIDLIKTNTLENLENEELYELVNSEKLEEHLNSGAAKNTDSIKSDSSAVQMLDEFREEI